MISRLWNSRWAPYSLFFLILLPYWNALGNPFLGDDEALIERNPLLRSWDGIFSIFSGPLTSIAPNYYRPLSVLSYWIDFHIFALQPWGFHLTQNLLHAAVALVFYRLLLLHFPRGISFFCALLYGLHPVHAAQVLPLGGRNGILEGLWVLTLYFFHQSTTRTRALLGAMLFFAAALLSKESAVLFPLIALLYARFFFRGQAREKLTARALALAGIALAYLAFRQTLPLVSMNSIAPIAELDFGARAWTALASLGRYAALLVWPHPLFMERQFVETSWFAPWAWLGLVLLAAALWSIWKKNRSAFGLLWFLLLLLPVSNLFVVLNMSMAEHWLYLPLMGLVFCLAGLLHRKYEELPQKLGVLFFAVAALYSARVYARSLDFRDALTLYRHDLEYSPNSYYLQANLGVEYSRQGNLFMAKSHLSRALEIAPRSGDVAFNLGAVFEKEGNIARAKELYARAIQSSWQPFMYMRLASLYFQEGRRAEGRAVLEEALRIHPENPEIRRILDVTK